MYTEKIHRIVNAKCKNAGKRQSMLKNTRNRQCKVKQYSETSMYTEKILRIVNVKVQGCWEMAMYIEKCSELSMQSGKMLGIIDARRKNTGKRQSMLKKYTESSMQMQECWETTKYAEKCSESSVQGERMIGNNNVRRKNTRNRQCEVKQYSETSMYTEKYLETSM